MFDLDEYVYEAMKAGASGFLLKNLPPARSPATSPTPRSGRLFLSEATIKSHVNRILSKLDLRDRTQATVLAYETGLVEPGDASRAEP